MPNVYSSFILTHSHSRLVNDSRQPQLAAIKGDWSLITGTGGGGGGGQGGATKRKGGGGSEVLPLRKGRGGGRKSLSHAKGGGAQQVLW